MPVRAIKQIKREIGLIGIVIPTSIVDVCRCPYNYVYDRYIDTLFCEFKNHFDKNKNLIRKINESGRLRVVGDCRQPLLLLTGNPISMKYGFCAGEYLEIIYQSIERPSDKKDKPYIIPIFPERIIEDLEDFEDK